MGSLPGFSKATYLYTLFLFLLKLNKSEQGKPGFRESYEVIGPREILVQANSREAIEVWPKAPRLKQDQTTVRHLDGRCFICQYSLKPNRAPRTSKMNPAG